MLEKPQKKTRSKIPNGSLPFGNTGKANIHQKLPSSGSLKGKNI